MLYSFYSNARSYNIFRLDQLLANSNRLLFSQHFTTKKNADIAKIKMIHLTEIFASYPLRNVQENFKMEKCTFY